MLRPLLKNESSSFSTLSRIIKRSFFASSTDHTTLLQNATAHRIGDDPYGARHYILVPHGTPLDLAKKVDKLQLARIFADRNVIFGAKVVQRTLGSPTHVCGSLLDMALTDASSRGERPQALSALDGLCEWVVKGVEGREKIETLVKLQESDKESYESLKAMLATGCPRLDSRLGWEDLAKEFIRLGLGDEAALYESKGAELVAIEILADESEDYLRRAGGAKARFSF